MLTGFWFFYAPLHGILLIPCRLLGTGMRAGWECVSESFLLWCSHSHRHGCLVQGERHIHKQGGFFLSYHLPTPDGGALVVWYVLDRMDGDTMSVAAIKLAQGYAVGIAPGRSIRRANAPLDRKKAGYDLLGRMQEGKERPAASAILKRRNGQ